MSKLLQRLSDASKSGVYRTAGSDDILHATNASGLQVARIDLAGAGKDALLARGATRRLAGLVLTDRGVMRSGQDVRCAAGSGRLTSGGYSPTLNRSIGLARLPGAVTDGATVEVRVRELDPIDPNCRWPLRPLPRCSIAQVWKHALADGAKTNTVAKVAFLCGAAGARDLLRRPPAIGGVLVSRGGDVEMVGELEVADA